MTYPWWIERTAEVTHMTKRLTVLFLLAAVAHDTHGQEQTRFTAHHIIQFAAGTAQDRKVWSAIPAARDILADAFGIAREDLNDDGSKEVILMAGSSAGCGSGGCRTFVLENRAGRAATILDQHLYAPLAVTSEKVAQYRALAAVDDKGVIVSGDRPGTPAFGRQMVYLVAPSRTAQADQPSPSQAQATASKANPDILGIRLGVSTVDDVRSVFGRPALGLQVEEELATLVGQARTGRGLSAQIDIPNSEHVDRLTGTSKTYKPSGFDAPCAQITVNCQSLHARFSAPPGKGIVLALTRAIHFAERPLTDTVIAGLVEKYGQPGFRDSYGDKGVELRLVWAWAADGSPVALNARHTCANQSIATMTTNGSIDGSRAAARAGCAAMLYVIISQANSVTEFQTLHAIDHYAIIATTARTSAFVEEGVARYEACERDKAARTSVPAEFGDGPATAKPGPAVAGAASPCVPAKNQ